MKKCFNNVQMFKSSENCDKYSKSVSYETLVIGAATICRDNRQIRRLFKGSVDKPLTAVGTFSAFNNVEKVVEKWLQIPPIFRLVKVLGLMAVLSVGMISESWADCWATEYNYIKSCYNTWEPGKPNNCGDGCTYTYNNGKLTVTATKPDAIIPEGIFSTNYYEEKAGFPNITNIEIAGEFKTIGKHAFLNNAATISGKGGVLYTNSIDHDAFGNNNTLTGTIIVSDKQTTLGEGPWYLANLNATVILPPTLRSISGMAIFGLTLGTNAKIYCGAENCKELFNEKTCDSVTGKDAEYKTICKNNLATLLASGKLLAYPDGCTKMGASGCTKCKNSNFKLNDGECDRLRYTPAEAAEVLHNDNTNSVTITFKK